MSNKWFDIVLAYLTFSSNIVIKSSIACLNALMMTVGWICCSRNGAATVNISPAENPKTDLDWIVNDIFNTHKD